jgi:predicted RNA binding protein YcfA (HicA-like mRNA interferase family)
VKYRQMTKIVEADGWYLVRQKGSHRHNHPEKPGLMTIAGAANDHIPPKTLARIYEQAQIPGPGGREGI